jgi:hypothetical protein
MQTSQAGSIPARPIATSKLRRLWKLMCWPLPKA